MKEYTLFGRVVLEDSVIEDGAVVVENGVITSVGERDKVFPTGELFDYGGRYIAPGFVDIHCHAGGTWWAYEDPVAMAGYHKAHGTTSLLCTLYRGFTQSEYMSFIERIREAMRLESTIKGVHMEGPYLNPRYGSASCEEGDRINKENYTEIAQSGVVKQWTFAPEVEGSEAFLRDIREYGICPAIGHSAASPAQVRHAAENGARLVTHLFDAAGCAIDPPSYDGTIEVSFSFAALAEDNLYYEIICDENGIHVRPELVRLAAKAAGVDRIVGVTDACTGDSSETDINIVNGELYGSKLTMNKAARNFHNIGFSIPEVFRITSTTPAKVIGLERTGSLKPSYAADIVVLDESFEPVRVFCAAESLEDEVKTAKNQ